MKIALASPSYPTSLADGINSIKKLTTEAAGKGANIICFPETFLPGYPGLGAEKQSAEALKAALDKACDIAATNNTAMIIPTDWYISGSFYNLAFVISPKGEVLGYQTKNQLDPSEDNIWAPGTKRNIFEVDGLKFGITICHEGFRYPESVRWAARNGAHIVFHPHCAGSNTAGPSPTEWGHKDNPYYEKAQMLRAMENTIYFATSNYTFNYPESASALIAPDGKCIAWQPYREAGVCVAEIQPDLATGFLAKRFKAELY